MVLTRTRPDVLIDATVAVATRDTPWELVDELPLRFDAFHPQGMVRIDGTWWISTVDVASRKGLLLARDERGGLVDEVAVGDAEHYHPGGIDFDGTAVWIAAAEYRPSSTSVVHRVVPGCDAGPEPVFAVDDHVGAIARCGADGDLVGWSWGSRTFFRWNVAGDLLDRRINPAFFVDHQDCQWLATGHVLCAGVAEVCLADGRGWLGGLGLLRADDLTMVREVPFPKYSTRSSRVATQNPLFAEVDGDSLLLHLLPDDGVATIVTYATRLFEHSG
jgi:hypothetical protein